MLAATSFAAGILALLFVGLSIRVIKQRIRAKASVGDHGDHDLLKAIRAQGNFAEYAPFGVIILGLLEIQNGTAWAVWVLALMLVTGRLSHAIGFGRTPQIIPLRKLGMMLTFLQIAISGLWVLVLQIL